MWLIVFAALSSVAFAVLGLFKYLIAEKLGSSAMKKDAYCSIAVAILSLGELQCRADC